MVLIILFLASWQVLNTPTDEDLLGLFFIDHNHGWVVGRNDVILYTSDGGDSWDIQNSTTNYYDLYDVVFTDPYQGWVCGWNGSSGFGVIIGTTNGGNTWRLQAGTGQASFTEGIDFVDNSFGWAVGYDIFSSASQSLRTTNGGNDWFDYTLPYTGYLKGVDFISQGTGLACGSYGLLIKSTDGGINWSEIPTGISQTLYQLKVFDENNIIIAGDTFLLTTDGGTNWIFRPIGGLRSLSFLSMAEGWVCGTGIFRTIDSGQTWIPETTGVGVKLNAIAMLDTIHGFAAGDNGIFLRRTIPPSISEETLISKMRLPYGIYDITGRKVAQVRKGIYFIVDDSGVRKVVRLK